MTKAGIKMFDIFEVADEFLGIESMTQKKLQKLCYYAQGWYVAITDRRLFNDQIQAWVHGPVSPKLYERYKMFGFNKIPKKESKATDDELKGIVKEIYRIYGKLDGGQLEELTHKEMPWINAREGLEAYESSTNAINIHDMKSFFKSKLLEEPNA